MKLKWPPRQPVAPLCCITMVKDEEEMLTQWISHYERHFSEMAYVIIDHASRRPVSEYVAEKWPGANVETIRLPDMPFDASFKASALSAMAGTMLGAYETVIVTDVDEIVIPLRPATTGSPSLSKLIERDVGDYVAPIGMEFMHDRSVDKEFHFGKPLTDQRNVLRLHAAYTKPVIWRATTASFDAGQHRMDRPYKVSETLGLAHLKFVDETCALSRQTQRNATKFADYHIEKGRGGVWKMDAHAKWSNIFDHVTARDTKLVFDTIYEAFRKELLKPVNDKGVYSIKIVSDYIPYR